PYTPLFRSEARSSIRIALHEVLPRTVRRLEGRGNGFLAGGGDRRGRQTVVQVGVVRSGPLPVLRLGQQARLVQRIVDRRVQAELHRGRLEPVVDHAGDLREVPFDAFAL